MHSEETGTTPFYPAGSYLQYSALSLSFGSAVQVFVLNPLHSIS